MALRTVRAVEEGNDGGRAQQQPVGPAIHGRRAQGDAAPMALQQLLHVPGRQERQVRRHHQQVAGPVTGEIGSPQGIAPITEGSWVDGKLTIAFIYVDGAAIQMTGAVTNGALGGSLSYGGGQMVVAWAAKKKVDK